MGQSEGIAFPYGRTALMGLLHALELRGREVICPAYTCVVVPHAIVTSGNTPVFVDSCETDCNMDLALAAGAVSGKTGALVATSIFGHPVDLDALRRFQLEHPTVTVIQDCAHSFGCSWNEHPVVTAGAAAFYGLNISKIMTSIFGGMVTTDDAALASRLRAFRHEHLQAPTRLAGLRRLTYLLAVTVAFQRPVYGLVNALERSGALDRFVKYYDESAVDMPDDHLVQMTSLAARVGIAQCERYADIIAHRRAIAAVYRAELGDVAGLRLPPANPGATWSHFVIRTEHAERLIRAARSAGVQLGEIIEYHIPDMPAYRSSRYVGSRVAAAWPNHIVNLPVHLGMNHADAVRLCQVIKRSLEAIPR